MYHTTGQLENNDNGVLNTQIKTKMKLYLISWKHLEV